MICVQLKTRAKVETGQGLRLQDAAQVIGPKEARTMPLPCPEELGIWKLPAIRVLHLLHSACPHEEIFLLGADVCYIHRVKPPHRDLTRPLRTLAAFLILMLGGALGLCWFHADVDMPRAQFAVYEAVTGRQPDDPRMITIPYAAGVALGVAVFYALPSRKATTPLDVKLTEYQADMEKTEARDFD